MLPENADVKSAFKWLYCPRSKTVLVGSADEHHIEIIRNVSSKHEAIEQEFFRWIRIINLRDKDFRKSPPKKPVICVREYCHDIDVTEKDIKKLIRGYGLEGKIIFGVTNDSLKELTGDYLRRW